MRNCPPISYREIRAPPSAVRSKVNISPLSFLLQQQLLTALPKAEAAFRMMPTAPEQPAPAVTPHPQSAVVPATSVQMLVQLAAADSSVERRRKMAENAGRFGWVQPPWAGAHAEKPEPWHWEFGVIS